MGLAIIASVALVQLQYPFFQYMHDEEASGRGNHGYLVNLMRQRDSTHRTTGSDNEDDEEDLESAKLVVGDFGN